MEGRERGKEGKGGEGKGKEGSCTTTIEYGRKFSEICATRWLFGIRVLTNSISCIALFPTPSTTSASHPPCLTTFQNLPPPL